MSMNQISRMLQGQGGGGAPANADTPQVDTAEQIYISSLALIKMLKHGTFSSDVSHVRVQCKLL
jgi:26S proteasome regulatory subunit N11